MSATASERLPPLITRYLERALIDASGSARRVRVEQVGEMRLKPGGRWLRFEATEVLDVQRVAFTWRARFPLAPLVWLRVYDGYVAGEGRLEARAWGVLPVMRARGHEVSCGEAMRYLSELMWAPQAMRENAELEWRDLDASSVEVAASVGSTRVALRLDFDTEGDLIRVSTPERPYMQGRRSVVGRPWAGAVYDYGVLGGVRVPTRAEVSWMLPEGEFTYWRGTVTSLREVA